MRLDQAVTFRSTFAVRDLSFQRRKRPRRSRPREPWRRRCIEERVSGSIVSEHVYNPSDRWDLIRRRLYSSGSPEPALWCLRDGLDPVAIIDSSANVLERYGYEAFGPVRFMDPAFAPRSASAHAWTWLFHAEFIDPETGPYNYGYHPQLGRWISRDPIGERGGLNLYGFVRNAGPNQRDILGLEDENAVFDNFNDALVAASLEAGVKTRRSERFRGHSESRREFCGLICECSGSYKYTTPHGGVPAAGEITFDSGKAFFNRLTEKTCRPDYDENNDSPVSCDQEFGAEWKFSGAYHSHMGNTPFSERDRQYARGANHTGLPTRLGLATPNGEVSILQPVESDPESDGAGDEIPLEVKLIHTLSPAEVDAWRERSE